MVRIAPLLFCLLPFVGFNQAVIKEIREVHPKRNTEVLIFPQVTITKNDIVSNKINDDLVMDFLDVDRKKIRKSIFENILGTEELPVPLLSEFSYSVLSNNKKFLSISISAEGCGAYCEHFTRYYSYDLKTGNRIELDTLLNKKGQTVLLDSVTGLKKRMLIKKITEIKDSLIKSSNHPNPDDKQYWEDMKELYEQCLEDIYTPELDYLQFYLTQTKLFIFIDRCSAHYNRNLDEIGDFEFQFELKNWKKYLTPYGLSLLIVIK